jgi:hypothetical protein
MKSNTLTSAVRSLPLLILVSGVCAFAQDRVPVHFTGLINDYSPSTVKGGPWEMHGQWILDLRKEWGREPRTADFTADMTMSGYGTTAGVIDATKGGQSPHTHHIKLTNAAITWNMDGCPAVSPATKTGFQINDTVSLITGNGSNAIFEPDPPTTKLQVCISGGDEVPGSVTNSNITLVFTGPATSHFGTQAIHGVVRRAYPEPIERLR